MTGAVQAMFAAGKPGTVVPPVQVSPPSRVTSSPTQRNDSGLFNATFTGGTPSSIVWSVENVLNGTAQVYGGQGTATVQINVTAPTPDSPVSCTVRCTAVIGGVSYSGTAYFEHNWESGGAGGQL